MRKTVESRAKALMEKVWARSRTHTPIVLTPEQRAEILLNEYVYGAVKTALEYEEYVKVAADYLAEFGELPETACARQEAEQRERALWKASD